MKHVFLQLFLLVLFLFPATVSAATSPAEPVREIKPSLVDPEVLAIIFSGYEYLHYSVSWSGGVKIGDIYLVIHPESEEEGAYRISAKVKDYGPLRLIYPVDDTFDCFVRGPMKLPYLYKVHQREGRGGREIRRTTWFDQELGQVRYQRNENKPELFEVEGPVYNEFAAFIITRALTFREGEAMIVPTFADRKSHEVLVNKLGTETRSTLFGEVQTLRIEPRLQFRGLYDKSGATVLWLTDDACRVPVSIQSRIVIGSLTADLVDYSNAACTILSPEPAP
ncbi:DUF3108 domain-containing protein [Desulfobulbus alkaliphilus]|uniref:DUF3108 domain-containing protein n=1 Tax=Desulfobulbus alkaliphilus TaxID=869814 RepID=UPI0019662774|nr:DUF3108 domain-containing protein [Desulfobulbus alkaliphilus]MBM9538411.1 DUF3108 domain-containing protein [Desulfobulbus alkaliphilus]